MSRLRAALVRSTYDWIVAHGLTPYMLVDVTVEKVHVPLDYAENEKIVLNMAPMAIRSLELGDEAVQFEASFSGESWDIYVPISAVQAMYSRETGQGIYARDEGFGLLVNEGETEDDLDPDQGDDDQAPSSARKNPLGLRIVK